MRNLWRILNLIRSVPALWMYYSLPCKAEIAGDLKRSGGASWWTLHSAMLENRVFRRIFYYRTHQQAPILTKLSKVLYRPFSSMELHADRIGGGMAVYHGYSTVVFAESIGEKFTVYQQVTIGRGNERNGRDIPSIGNNVTVYAGAIIVGGITIGDNAVIGAGAVVTKDVPADAVVVGAPMRMLNERR